MERWSGFREGRMSTVAVLGPRGSGKTVMVHALMREAVRKHENIRTIVYISPHVKWEKPPPISGNDGLPLPIITHNGEDLHVILTRVFDMQDNIRGLNNQCIVVFDDFDCLRRLPHERVFMNHIFMNNRSMNITLIVTCQTVRDLNPMYRTNMDVVVMMGNSYKIEQDMLFRAFDVQGTKEEFALIYRAATRKHYEALVLDRFRPNEQLWVYSSDDTVRRNAEAAIQALPWLHAYLVADLDRIAPLVRRGQKKNTGHVDPVLVAFAAAYCEMPMEMRLELCAHAARDACEALMRAPLTSVQFCRERRRHGVPYEPAAVAQMRRAAFPHATAAMVAEAANDLS
jgi:ABC-type dipeptide/oligopeptide/nickel transport system ATPase component